MTPVVCGDERLLKMSGNDVMDMLGKIMSRLDVIEKKVGGKGGGRADMAMAGGGDPSALPAALDSVKSWVLERINK